MNWTKNNSGWVDGTGKKIETAPIQTSKYDDTVPRLVAEEAYKEYAELYGTTQSLDRLCERGGFAASEIAGLLYRRIKRLESSLPNVRCGDTAAQDSQSEANEGRYPPLPRTTCSR